MRAPFNIRADCTLPSGFTLTSISITELSALLEPTGGFQHFSNCRLIALTSASRSLKDNSFLGSPFEGVRAKIRAISSSNVEETAFAAFLFFFLSSGFSARCTFFGSSAKVLNTDAKGSGGLGFLRGLAFASICGTFGLGLGFAFGFSTFFGSGLGLGFGSSLTTGFGSGFGGGGTFTTSSTGGGGGAGGGGGGNFTCFGGSFLGSGFGSFFGLGFFRFPLFGQQVGMRTNIYQFHNDGHLFNRWRLADMRQADHTPATMTTACKMVEKRRLVRIVLTTWPFSAFWYRGFP